MAKASIACGVQNCLGQLWTTEDYTDFTVVVEDMEFKCHRFMLAACSEFFRGLLRSGMKENQENRVHLRGMSIETFTVIINAVYTGVNHMTVENILDVWHGSDQLQIDFLKAECEDFVKEKMTLENFLEFYNQARLLGSQRAKVYCNNFMAINFEHFRSTSTFCQLEYDELVRILKDDDLNISSEDKVIESVLQWVSYVPQNPPIKETTVNESQAAMDGNNSGMKRSLECKSEETDVDDEKKTDSEEGDQLQTSENPEQMDTPTQSTFNYDSDNHSNDSNGTDDENEIEASTNPQLVHDKPQAKTVKAFFSDRSDYWEMPRKQTSSSNGFDRFQHLGKIMSAVRTCTATSRCLEDLMKNPLITKNWEALDIIHDAVLYQWKDLGARCWWPSTAAHRTCSELMNAMVFVDGTDVKVFNLCTLKFHKIGEIKLKKFEALCEGKVSLAIHKQSLLLSFRYENPTERFVRIAHFAKTSGLPMIGTLEKKVGPYRQSTVMNISSQNIAWITNSYHGEMTEQTFNLKKQFICFNNLNILLLIEFEEHILVFSGSPDFQIQLYDKEAERIWNKKLTMPQNTDITHLVSFKDDQYTYILGSSGHLWIIVGLPDSKTVDLKLVGQMKGIQGKLNGAVIYREKLYLFVTDTPWKSMKKTNLPGMFETILMVPINSSSNCVPTVFENVNVP